MTKPPFRAAFLYHTHLEEIELPNRFSKCLIFHICIRLRLRPVYTPIDVIWRSIHCCNLERFNTRILKVMSCTRRYDHNVTWANGKHVAIQHRFAMTRLKIKCLLNVLVCLFSDFSTQRNTHRD